MPQQYYRKTARVAVAIPPANPTVEPELKRLLPDGVALLPTPCRGEGTPQERLPAYFNRLDDCMADLSGQQPHVLGFACTASSYLLQKGQEQEAVTAFRERHGLPLITACAAIASALEYLGARRLALASPYPAWLHEASTAYWQESGWELAATVSACPEMGDTRAIYTLDVDAAGQHLAESLAGVQADVLLITGTGMPSLGLIALLRQATGLPVVTSNLCLAWACLEATGVAAGERAASADDPLLAGW